jgi:hypothetical protein
MEQKSQNIGKRKFLMCLLVDAIILYDTEISALQNERKKKVKEKQKFLRSNMGEK